MTAVSYAADIWLGTSEAFMTPDRPTAAAALADALSLAGCHTALDAFTRLGLEVDAYSRWWELPLAAFNIQRLVDDDIDPTYRGPFGRYRQPCANCGAELAINEDTDVLQHRGTGDAACADGRSWADWPHHRLPHPVTA